MEHSPSAQVGINHKSNWGPIVGSLLIPAIYCLLFSQFLKWLLPGTETNVNAVFVSYTWKIFFLASLGAYPLFLAICKIRKTAINVIERRKDKISVADTILILLPLTPVVQYVVNNQDILSVSGSLAVIAAMAAFSIILVLLIPALFSIVGSPRPLALFGMAYAFTITNMASLTAHSKWFERGELKIQFALFVSVFMVALLLYNIVGRKFTHFVVGLFFVANSVNGLISVDRNDGNFVSDPVENKITELIADRRPLTTPNIYFLVYDAYVGSETMNGYGIDNSAQEAYLTKQGFQFYPHAYSISASSIPTISRIFNVSRSLHAQPRKAVSGDGHALRLLQEFGYKTHGLFWSDYFFQNVGSHYDSSFPEPAAPEWMLVKAIFMGEFRFDSPSDNPPRQEFLERKVAVFENNGSKPKFVYIHDDHPGHSQNSGICLPDETDRFIKRLKVANAEMKRNVDLIRRADPEAIVIVAGDHGPYLTKNCTGTRGDYDIAEISRLDLQDRYGTFLAIKWPDEKFEKYDDIVIIQDLFPVIFSFLFEDDSFLSTKMTPITGSASITTSGAEVRYGLIRGGIHDGEPIFLGP
ncbi:MAG: hypothetical protein ABFS42_02025 [Candidatus Krumholzibacteriota bacterium]